MARLALLCNSKNMTTPNAHSMSFEQTLEMNKIQFERNNVHLIVK